jgi:hypothetical protein
MNETNRAAIVVAAAVWIVLMAVIIYLAWGPDARAIDRLGDFVEYLDAHRDTAGRLIITLAASLAAAVALFVIVLELAPEEQARELRVEQAGATTIVPAGALRMRLEEGLVGLPDVQAAKTRVASRDKGVSALLDLTITSGTNVATVTQEANRVVVDIIQTELGLPLAGLPTVRINFAPRREPVASSVSRPPEGASRPAILPEEAELGETETVDERFEAEPKEAPPPAEDRGPATAPEGEHPEHTS